MVSISNIDMAGIHMFRSAKNVSVKIVIFLLPIFSICFGCSKELSHIDGSFEYLQHALVEK